MMTIDERAMWQQRATMEADSFEAAVERVLNTPELYPYYDVLLYEDCDDIQAAWVATSSVADLVEWAREQAS